MHIVRPIFLQCSLPAGEPTSPLSCGRLEYRPVLSAAKTAGEPAIGALSIGEADDAAVLFEPTVLPVDLTLQPDVTIYLQAASGQ